MNGTLFLVIRVLFQTTKRSSTLRAVQANNYKIELPVLMIFALNVSIPIQEFAHHSSFRSSIDADLCVPVRQTPISGIVLEICTKIEPA